MTSDTSHGNSDSGQNSESNENETRNNDIDIKEGYGHQQQPRMGVFAIFVMDSLAYLVLLTILNFYGPSAVQENIVALLLLYLLTAMHGYFLFEKGEKSNRIFGYVLTQLVTVTMFRQYGWPEMSFTGLVLALWVLQMVALVLDVNIYLSKRTEFKTIEAQQLSHLRPLLGVVVPSTTCAELETEPEGELGKKKIQLVRDRAQLRKGLMILICNSVIALFSLLNIIFRGF
ncbi:hypothetical protein IV203_033276 [Nitzschia inconspicua]|uniref:Uncharacterized protein n=1 Tax=Nitzschia inconspicua TaxID=303405 RepID=A0A9K3PFW9_9STRA|nr:hypothetical protein IV203_033276 [Nitzschia inconspicua]